MSLIFLCVEWDLKLSLSKIMLHSPGHVESSAYLNSHLAIKLTFIIFDSSFRYGEHKICICRSEGHNLTVKSKGIQLSLNNNQPCCDIFTVKQSSLSQVNWTALTRYTVSGRRRANVGEKACGKLKFIQKKFHQHTNTKHEWEKFNLL